MNMFITTINITIDAEESRDEVEEQVEQAMKVACSHLEQNLKHEVISYQIRRLEEL